MGGTPVIETVRPGVQFTPAAAASFRRLEARLGRRADVNRTYADYATQMRMYLAWQAWVSGRGPKPNHSRALHPDESVHCRGEAWDSDDWRTPGFIPLAAEYGWIRTAANDPTEQHHFEYKWQHDQHRNDPVPTGAVPAPAPPKEDDDMLMIDLTGLGPGSHKIAVGNGVLKHFVSTDPYNKVMQVSRINDDWQPLTAAELPALLHAYGCDLRIWDYRDGNFVVLDPLTGNVGPGNAWTATGAIRAAIAGIKVEQPDPLPIVAAVERAITAGLAHGEDALAEAVRTAVAHGIDLDEQAIAAAVRDRLRTDPLT